MFWGSQLGALVRVTVEADEVTGIPFWVIKGAGSFRVKSQFPLNTLAVLLQDGISLHPEAGRSSKDAHGLAFPSLKNPVGTGI